MFSSTYRGKGVRSYNCKEGGLVVRLAIRYFRRASPRCVTSILTPLRAFLSCKFRRAKSISMHNALCGLEIGEKTKKGTLTSSMGVIFLMVLLSLFRISITNSISGMGRTKAVEDMSAMGICSRQTS